MAPGSPSHEKQRKQRLAAKHDPVYRRLVNALGPRNFQDAWHIVTAERNGCYCFLTMDCKLIRNVRTQSKNEAIKALRVRVLSPQKFGKSLGSGSSGHAGSLTTRLVVSWSTAQIAPVRDATSRGSSRNNVKMGEVDELDYQELTIERVYTAPCPRYFLAVASFRKMGMLVAAAGATLS